MVALRNALDEGQKKALHLYRADTAERHGILDRMRSLWKLTDDARDLSVLETVVEEATHYLPLEGRKQVVSFLT